MASRHPVQDAYAFRHANAELSLPDPQFTVPSSLPQRPKNFNTYGKEATVKLNTFNVIKPPSIAVHQYDVSYTGDSRDYSKRALVRKIWKSKAVQAELSKSDLWIWDGNKLAWWVLSLFI